MGRLGLLVILTALLMGAFAATAHASMVTNVTVTNVPPLPGGGTTATNAPTVYETTFTATTGLSGAQADTITIAFPGLTSLGNLTNSGIVTDNTAPRQGQVGGSCSASGTTETCSIFGGSTVAAGDSLTVELDGVVNPSRPSMGYTVSVSTSKDTTAAPSNNYTVAAAQSVSGVTVTNLPPLPGGGTTATNAPTVYKTTFTTSSTGGMVGAAGSKIMIAFPSGTGLAHLTNSGIVTDNTAPRQGQVGGSCSASGTTETCSIFGGSTVLAGDGITVELDGVTNPATPSNANNLYSVSVTTASDNNSAIPSNNYTVAAAQSVSGVTVTNLPPLPGGGTTATNAPTVYKTTFTTSSTGGMVGAAGSKIMIAFPSGTGLAHLTNSGIVTDNTAPRQGQVGGSCSASGTTETCSIFGGSTVLAGDGITVELDGVTNPATPSNANNLYSVSVTTASDNNSAIPSNNYTVAAAQSASGASVTLSNGAAAATGVAYRTTFTTSSTGGMVGAAGSTITIAFPSGTGLAHLTNSGIVTDNTAPRQGQVGGSCSASGTTETCSIFGGSTVLAGDSITVELDGVTNPSTLSTTDTAAVSTSSDRNTVNSSQYTISNGPTPPTISAISPSSGPTSSDTVVTITGTNFATALRRQLRRNRRHGRSRSTARPRSPRPRPPEPPARSTSP